MEHFFSWGGSERFRRLGLYEDLTRGNRPTIRRVKILITYARRSQPDFERVGSHEIFWSQRGIRDHCVV